MPVPTAQCHPADFLAPDKGWQAYKQVQSTAQVLAKIARELEHSMNPDMDTRESIFARMYWRVGALSD